MSRSVSLESVSSPAGFPVSTRPKSGAKTGGKAIASARLTPVQIAAISKAREARWRPGLRDQPLHSEIFAKAGDASGAGLALALARDALRTQAQAQAPLAEPHDRRHVLWVQERRAIQLSGRPYVHGLPADWRERLIHVEAATPEDALFALEEGLKCRDLACVIGEISGNPRALDFTASRRLSLAAEKHGVALWLVRLEAEADLSSARMRWRVEAAASEPPLWNADAPGEASWNAELFRARSHAPGRWILSDDETSLNARQPGASHANEDDTPTPTPGLILARQHRLWRQGRHISSSDTRDLVRATVGRSLASCARM